MMTVGLHFFSFLVTAGSAATPPPAFQICDPSGDLAKSAVSAQDLAASVRAAREFLISAVGVQPSAPPQVRPALGFEPNRSVAVVFDDEYAFEVNARDKGIRSFLTYGRHPEPATTGPVMTDTEATRRLTEIAGKLGLFPGAALVYTYHPSVGTAATPAGYLFCAVFGFRDHDLIVPASSIHLGINLRTGRVYGASVDRRSYKIETSEAKLTPDQAKAAALQILKKRAPQIWEEGGPGFDPGSSMVVGLEYWDAAEPKKWPKTESVPARIRPIWLCRYDHYMVGVDAATGAVLHYAGPK